MLSSWQSVETSGVVASVVGPDGSVVVIIYVCKIICFQDYFQR